MSDWKPISAYATAWSFTKGRGKLRIVAEDGTTADVEVASPEELAAVADMLRNEDEAFFDEESKSIRTGFEIPGGLL